MLREGESLGEAGKTKIIAIILVLIIIAGIGAGIYYYFVARPKPLKLLLTYNVSDPDERKVAEILKVTWAELGIDLETRGMEWDAQWELAKADPLKAQDVFVFYWWPTILSAYDYLFNMFHSEEEILFNLCYYNNSEFDELIDEAFALEGANRTKALELYEEAQTILMEDCPAICFYDLKNIHIIRKGIKGYADNPAYPHVVFWYELQPPTDSENDTFVEAWDSIIFTTCDPSESFSNEIIVMHSMYETLLRYLPNGTIVGVLATNWTVSEDGKTWTFWLRKDVKFHDGTPFNATAVKFSIERTIDMGMGAAFIWDSVDQIITFDDNPYKVQFKLKYPAPLDTIACSSYGAFIFSPSLAKQGNNTQIWQWLNEGVFKGSPPYSYGTGPYYLYDWKPGEYAIFKKFDDYWGGWDGPHYEMIIVKYVAEPTTRKQGIIGEEYDWTLGLPLEELDDVDASGVAVVVATPSYQNLLGLLNTRKPPLDNKLVRQALAYATPYEQIINEVMLGKYAVKSVGPVPRGIFGFSENIPQYEFNLTKAAELFEQAGIKTPKSAATIMADIVSLIPCFLAIAFSPIPVRKRGVDEWDSEAI